MSEMSRLDELIAELCPDGVEYKRLGDISEIIVGFPFQSERYNISGKGIRLLRGINIKHGHLYWGDETRWWDEDVLKYEKYFLKSSDIVIPMDGSRVGKNYAFISENDLPLLLVQRISLIRSKQDVNSRYLWYCVANKAFENYVEKVNTGTAVPHISGKQISDYKIPLPPLEVQREIVRILDAYSEKVAELMDQLAVELDARKKQYEYYRDDLLTFTENHPFAELCPDEVEYKTLGEVAEYSKKRISASSVDAQNYVGVDNLLPNKKGKTCSVYVPSEGNLISYFKGDILIGNIRPYLKKIWLATSNGGTNGDVLVIQIKDSNALFSEYLYYVLASDQFFDYAMQYSKGAKMPRGDKESILKYKIPLPPLDVQEKIVSILDRFGKLCTEISAEIEARRKQYEHYRDQLLIFEEKTA